MQTTTPIDDDAPIAYDNHQNSIDTTKKDFICYNDWRRAGLALTSCIHPRLGIHSTLKIIGICYLFGKIMACCLSCDMLTTKAMKAITRNRFDAGFRYLQAALKKEPDYLPAILALRSLRLYRPFVGHSIARSAAALMRVIEKSGEGSHIRAEQYFSENDPISPHSRFLHGCYFYFLKKEYAAAVPLWEPLNTCPMAQNCLGNCYCDGEGVPKDGEKGMKLFLLAAEKGHAAAINNIGFCYLTGSGVEQNPSKSIEIFMQASKSGSVQACFNIAWSYENGKDLPMNPRLAIEYYRNAANEDHTAAQINLGLMYRRGVSVTTVDRLTGNIINVMTVPRNLAKARKWLAMAAPVDEDAQIELEMIQQEQEQERQEHEQQQQQQPHE